MKTIVAVKNATKNYALGKVTVPALRGVDLEVAKGEFLSIAGPSGSGKTTLLNLIGCVDTPTSGSVEVAGKDTRELSERELTDLRLNTIGFIFQSFNLVQVLSVFQNVELPLLLQKKLNGPQRAERVQSLLTRVGLAEHIRHRPSELSGGQRQRVAIARALVTRPQLVLADEPTGNLDPTTSGSVFQALFDLARIQGVAAVIATHNLELAGFMDRVFALKDGHLVERVG